jgi:hypothetical protein
MKRLPSGRCVDASRNSLLRQTILELLGECLLVQIVTDEDQLAEPRLFLFPEPIPVDREPIVDTVEDRSPGIPANPNDSLRPVNLAPLTKGL